MGIKTLFSGVAEFLKDQKSGLPVRNEVVDRLA